MQKKKKTNQKKVMEIESVMNWMQKKYNLGSQRLLLLLHSKPIPLKIIEATRSNKTMSHSKSMLRGGETWQLR